MKGKETFKGQAGEAGWQRRTEQNRHSERNQIKKYMYEREKKKINRRVAPEPESSMFSSFP